MPLEDVLSKKDIITIEKTEFNVYVNEGSWYDTDFRIKPGVQFGIRIDGAECYAILRAYNKRPDLTNPAKIPVMSAGNTLSDDACHAVTRVLFSLSLLRRPKEVIKRLENPPRTLRVEYPAAPAQFGRTFIDFTTPNQSICEYLDKCATDTAQIFGEKMKGTVVYNMARTALDELENWYSDTVPFEWPGEFENFGDFLLHFEHKEQPAIDIMINRMIRKCRRENKIMIRNPNSYKDFLLAFHFDDVIFSAVHERMMTIYEKEAQDTPRRNYVQSIREKIAEQIRETLEKTDIQQSELRWNVTMPKQFKLPIIGHNHSKKDYDAVYSSLQAQDNPALPAELSTELRKLGFYVLRKSKKDVLQSYALVKINV